ncbi:SdiA-regulated domain-containing protein [Pedobacter sp. P351]|uniref:SdiA-regulated domain-containing protein n=1 Tax=Pedobacter superstes TaxID=3133441 RepID=UPI003098C50C
MNRSKLFSGKKNDEEKKEKKKKDKDDKEGADLVILEKWDLPENLKEISALSFIDNDRFACIQDEKGKIFIYNTKTNKIEKEIPFGDDGDYEGLALAGQDAFVLQADGVIFQVKNYTSAKPLIIEHKTHLTSEQDPEAMCYDSKNNRLLVAIKDSEPEHDDYKGIYAFNLTELKMEEAPVFKINLNDQIFEKVKEKKKGSAMQPSDIAIHPKTGDIYITEGTKPKLLILDSKGNAKKLFQLKSSDFNQPEGISFSPEGDLYISNEGGKEPGNILKVQGLQVN